MATATVKSSEEDDRWNPAHFGGEIPKMVEGDGQVTIFYDHSLTGEPPEPDDFATTEEFEKAWSEWKLAQQPVTTTNSDTGELWRCKYGLHPTIAPDEPDDGRFIRCDTLPIAEQIKLCNDRIAQQQHRIDDLMKNCKAGKSRDKAIASAENAIAEEQQRIAQLSAVDDVTLQRIYRFLVGRNRPYTSKEIAEGLQLDIDEVGKILIEGRDKYFVQPAVFQWALKDEIDAEGMGNRVDNDSPELHTPTPEVKESDKWYTPPNIIDLVTQVLGEIDLDPCADDGKHITAANHYTASDDGLSQEWYGRVFMNPPYSCPGKWMAKLQAEVEAGRVTEAIALVPASTDTNWLSPLLKSQPICFWKGRIKFLDTNYKPKQPAKQSHCLVYWGANEQKFKQVFDEVGVVKNVEVSEILTRENVKPRLYVIDQQQTLGVVRENLGFGFTVYWIKPDSEITYNWERDSDVIQRLAIAPQSLIPQPPNLGQVFEYCASRPATTEDIKILVKGDWIKAKDNPWCYQFKRWDGDICVGTWQGKEFLVPQDLLMVLTAIDDRTISKFKDAKSGDTLLSTKSLDENLPPIKSDDTEFKKVVAELEQGFKQIANESKGETMTLQFTQTQEITNQIAQLQQQLNKLTASLQPYRECEQKAEELLQQVAEHSQLMRDKGIDRNDLLNYAQSLFTAVTDAEINPLSNVDTIAAQNKEIERLKTELTAAQKRADQSLVDRMEAMALLENTTAQRDEALAKYSELTAGSARVAEKLKSVESERDSLKLKIQELEKLTDDMDAQLAEQQPQETKPNFAVGDTVQNAEGKTGVVTYIPEPFRGIVSIKTDDGAFNYLASNWELSTPTQADDSYTKDLIVGDIVKAPSGLVGTVTGFAYGNVVVKLVDSEYQFKRSELKWISTPDKKSASKSHNFQEGDRVEISTTDDELEDLNQRLGVVVGVKGNSVAVLVDATDDEGQKEVILSACHLKFIRAKSPEIEAQNRGREFIQGIKSKTGMNNISWQKISDVCQGDVECLKEIHLSAKTNLQKELIGKLPQLMADYISETGDITDMQWIPDSFKTKVEALLEAKKSLMYHPGNWVRNTETGKIWQVRSFDGEWLSVKQGNKIASLHKSEVELVQQEAA